MGVGTFCICFCWVELAMHPACCITWPHVFGCCGDRHYSHALTKTRVLQRKLWGEQDWMSNSNMEHLLIVFIYFNLQCCVCKQHFKAGQKHLLTIQQVVINLQQLPSFMIGSWAGNTKISICSIFYWLHWDKRPLDNQTCKLTSSLMFSFFLEFRKNHDRKTNQSTAGIRGTANAQATSSGL